MASQGAKQKNCSVRWLPSARKAYTQSITYIASQDQQASMLVGQRVEKALLLISAQPEIGTPTRAGRRRYPVPKTGHILEYYIASNEVRITRWARHSRGP